MKGRFQMFGKHYSPQLTVYACVYICMCVCVAYGTSSRSLNQGLYTVRLSPYFYNSFGNSKFVKVLETISKVKTVLVS